jgi:hypothetical protein
MKIIQRWLLLMSLSLPCASFSNGTNGDVLPTIENDAVRIALSIADASLTVVDKRITLEWRQQVRPGFHVAPDSVRVSPSSLSATVLGEGTTYVLTVSLTKESPYAFDLVLDMPDRHYAAMPLIPSPCAVPPPTQRQQLKFARQIIPTRAKHDAQIDQARN